MTQEIQLNEDHEHFSENNWHWVDFLENDDGLIGYNGPGNSFDITISNLNLDGTIDGEYVDTEFYVDTYNFEKMDTYRFGDLGFEFRLRQWRHGDDDFDGFRLAYAEMSFDDQAYKDWSFSIEFDYTVTVDGAQYQSHASYFIGEHRHGLDDTKEVNVEDIQGDVFVKDYGYGYIEETYVVTNFEAIFGDYSREHPDIPIRFNGSNPGAIYDSDSQQLLVDVDYINDMEPGSTGELRYGFLLGDDSDLTWFYYTVSFTAPDNRVFVDETGVAEGTEGDEVMLGSDGDDVMNGGGGNDRFEADAGNDVLVGGAGDDTYMLAPGSGVDRIIDDGGTIDLFADIPDDMISMILYEINGKPELHISLLDEQGNETGDKLIIENFGVEPSSGGVSGGNGILGWNIPPSDPTGPGPRLKIAPDLTPRDRPDHDEIIITPPQGAKADVQILDFDAADLRLMRDAENADDLIVYFRDEPNISLRIEDHFDNEGFTVPAVRGIVFHEAEDMDLTQNLTLEGTAADEVIRGSGHDDILIGGGGDDVFAGTRTELWNDSIRDVNLNDGIQVLDANFSYENVTITEAGLLSVDLNPDEMDGNELELQLENWGGLGFKVIDLGEEGTLIDFASVAPTVTAYDICVAGGARIDLTRLFAINDVDDDLAGYEIKVSFDGVDVSGVEAAFLQTVDGQTLEERWGVNYSDYLADLTSGVIGSGLYQVGEAAAFFAVDTFKDFDFLTPGEWLNPGTWVNPPGWLVASVLYEHQAFTGGYEFELRAVDQTGNYSDWATANLFIDRYGTAKEDYDGYSLDGFALTNNFAKIAMKTMDGIFQAYSKSAGGAAALAENPDSKFLKFLANDVIGDYLAKLSKGLDVYKLIELESNWPEMTDREFTNKRGAVVLDISLGLLSEGLEKALIGGGAVAGPPGVIAGWALGVVIDFATMLIQENKMSELLMDYIYEVRFKESPEKYSEAEVLELISTKAAEYAETEIARTSVMTNTGDFVPAKAVIDAEDILNNAEEMLPVLKHVEDLVIIGGDNVEIVSNEGGILIKHGINGDEQTVLTGFSEENVSHFESHTTYAEHIMENVGLRDTWEKWVRSEGNSVDYTASDHDDLLIGSDGEDTFAVGGGDDEIYGAEGADAMLIAAGVTADSDSFRFIDFNAEEGDVITLSGFDRDRTISSMEDLQAMVDAGYATIEAWDDETGDLDVSFTGLDSNLIDLDNLIELDKSSVRTDAGGGNDTVLGGKNSDEIFGGAGDDYIDGGKGKDQIHGGTGNDVILGEKDNDSIWGDAGDDFIDGGHGKDVLFGGADNDTIDGGHGNDLIEGGLGDDLLIGGHGKDVFVFNLNSGADIIQDFDRKHDEIDLSAYELTFSDLKIEGVNGGTLISDLGEDDGSIFLAGLSENHLSDSAFIF